MLQQTRVDLKRKQTITRGNWSQMEKCTMHTLFQQDDISITVITKNV